MKCPLRNVVLTFAWIGLTVAAAGHAYHPNHPLGFAPERAYQGVDQIDHVDLFSGTLSLTLPIGPFALHYSSNVWRYQEVVENSQVEIEARPDRLRFGGLGWHIAWGMVYSPAHALNDTGQWLFVDEDGARHLFYDELHRGESDGDWTVRYTRDGSYLRMKNHDGFFVDIESPDGTTRRYNSWSGGFGARYWFEKLWSPYASAADPDVLATYNATFTEWTLAERHGRTHKVFTNPNTPWLWTVDRIEVGTVGGGFAPYDLHYVTTPIDVSCKDTAASTPQRISVPRLTAIDLPDGTRFEMPSYHTNCQPNIDDVTGTLREITLPTGGGIRWTYQKYEYPPGGTNSVFNTSAGVATRELVRKSGVTEGTWRYRTTDIGAGGSGLPVDDPKMITEVVYPTGDCSKHFFNARYWQNPAQGRGWEYGLPFDYAQSEAGRYLSTEIWTGSTAAGQCDPASEKLRSTYVEYRRDATPGSGNAPAADWYNTNRQVQATRTVFHDDGDRWVDTDREDFDGLGHFRKIVTTGNLAATSTNQERRTRHVDFNRVAGTYGQPGYAPPAPSDPWVLGIHGFLRTIEAGAFGQQFKRVETSFDSTTGNLLCTRVRKSDSGRRSRDIVTTYTRNGAGQVTDVKTYGGDLQGLGTTGAACGDLPAQPEYWVRHGYEHGVRTSSRPMQPDGTPGPFLTLDIDVDPTTGALSTSRDPSGYAVQYGYDALGRNTSIIPQEGARTVLQYFPPNALAGAKAVIEMRDPSSGTTLTRSETWLDDFGRTIRERGRLPGNVWSERTTSYNARGWTTAVSEWGNTSKKTQFLDFDPFGRPAVIRPPDGAAHDVVRTYVGNRRIEIRNRLALPSGEAWATRAREFDSHGRLIRVEEPSGAGASIVPTTYDYDVAGRLTRARSGTSTVQERRFEYDNRGFLLSETHPEKGPIGNGTVVYGYRDSRGLIHRITDGPSDLSFGYDFLGRRTRVWDRNEGLRVVVRMDYDGAPGRGMGKLWKATRNQWVDVPWIAGTAESQAQVIEAYSYQGLGGSVSAKDTTITVGGEVKQLQQQYTWNDLGRRASLQWAGTSVSHVYDQGMLVDTAGWGAVTYHSSGLWERVRHTNGVDDIQNVDANFTRRTRALWSIGAQVSVGTGDMAYDGAGNVKEIGVWSYAYDEAGRLVHTDFGDWDQQLAYDEFGNLVQKTTTPPGGTAQTLNFPINRSTNRLPTPGHAYDAAGNLTAWGSNVYTWNESGLLEHTRGGSFDWVYLYDVEGERVATLMPSSSPVIRWTERDLGDRMITEQLQVGAIGAAGTTVTTKRYVYGGDRLLGSDGPDGIRHYHLDHLGSLRMATDPSGAPVFGMSFLPYGEATDPIDSSEIVHFTGHERDHPTGLDYMHARYYTQTHGRFLSTDQKRGVTVRPQSLNRYAYTEGNPMTFVDPDGRESAGIMIDARNRALLRGDITREEWAAQQRELARGAFMVGGGVAAVSLCVAFPPQCAVVGSYVLREGLIGAVTESHLYLGSTLVTNSFSWNDLGRAAGTGFITGQLPGISPAELLLQGATVAAINAPSVEAAEAQPPVEQGSFDAATMTLSDSIDAGSGSSTNLSVGHDGQTIDASTGSQTAFAGSDTVCNQQGCFQFTVAGTDLGEIIREAQRIAIEIAAVGGLNDLIYGACIVNPYACAAGGYGGGSGINPWTTIYSY